MPLLRYYPGKLTGGTEENPRKTLVRIISVLPEIRTEHLPNTGIDSYRYANLLVPFPLISVSFISIYISPHCRTNLHQVPRLRMVEIYLHSSICMYV
jgi:hypothetical protein